MKELKTKNGKTKNEKKTFIGREGFTQSPQRIRGERKEKIK